MQIFNFKKINKEIILRLKHIYDPEIPVNIYDFGLVYEIKLKEKDNYVFCGIKMTLSSPTCPVANALLDEVKQVCLTIDFIDEVEVQLVFEPIWSTDKISQEGYEILLMNGTIIPS